MCRMTRGFQVLIWHQLGHQYLNPAEALLPPASPGLLLLRVLQGLKAVEETKRVQRKKVHAAAACLNFTDLVLTSQDTTNSKWLV